MHVENFLISILNFVNFLSRFCCCTTIPLHTFSDFPFYRVQPAALLLNTLNNNAVYIHTSRNLGVEKERINEFKYYFDLYGLWMATTLICMDGSLVRVFARRRLFHAACPNSPIVLAFAPFVFLSISHKLT